MGFVDRLIRVVVAVIIAVAFFSHQITGTFAAVALIIAIIFLVTAFIGFCPLYKPFGISTRKKEAV